MTDEGGVLGNLPNSRPGKRSAKRDRPAGAKRAGSVTAKPRIQRATAAKEAEPARTREAAAGDPIGAAVRAATGLAATGVKVAGAVSQELFRRLPRP